MKRAGMIFAAWIIAAAAAMAQMQPPKPAPDLKKLDIFVGSWTLDGTMKPGMMGPGGSVTGYSADDKAYTYREFNSFGEFDDSRGSLDGDTWTWTNEEKMGGMTMKGRFTMKITSASSYNFTFDMSPDGTKWSTVMDGKASKK